MEEKLGDSEYFRSYENLEIHQLMIEDKVRTLAYRDAIILNKHLFQGKIVMDVGAGTGILSLFAAAAGASRVYAVEASDTAKLIKQVAEDNNFSDVITVMGCRVEDLCLSQNMKVDVIISEWMGFYLMHESMLNSVVYARDHFLKDDGTIFPSEARIYACPCSLPEFFAKKIEIWNNVYGFNMRSVGSAALRTKSNKPEVSLIRPDDLLSKPIIVQTFDLRYVTTEELTDFAETTFISVTRTGAYQGVCLWFEVDFNGIDYDEVGKEFGKLVTLSTSPFCEATHWKQTIIVFGENNGLKLNSNEETNDCSDIHTSSDVGIDATCRDVPNFNNEERQFVQVEEGEIVGWRLRFLQCESNARHYSITFEMLDPETEQHPMPCSCGMARCLIIAKLLEQDVD